MRRAIQFITAICLLVGVFMVGEEQPVRAQEIITQAQTIYLPVMIKGSMLPPPLIPGGDMGAWPAEVNSITIPQPYGDGTQGALWFNPNKSYPVPLVVSLHTWSTDYTKNYPQNIPVARWAIANSWVFIHPNFRGMNSIGNTAAMGSNIAVQDVVDAVEYAKSQANIDLKRIYIFGQSGGGHMALLMAGRRPDIWAGVSAWAPITDLFVWQAQALDTVYWIEDGVNIHRNIPDKYGDQIRLTCNNDGKSLGQCTSERSPITYLPNAINLPLDINAGFFDGYNGDAVPISHSLYGWNQVVPNRQFSVDEVNQMTGAQGIEHNIPSYLAFQGYDPSYIDTITGTGIPVLMRRESGSSRITIFNGSHANVAYWAALTWLYYQTK